MLQHKAHHIIRWLELSLSSRVNGKLATRPQHYLFH